MGNHPIETPLTRRLEVLVKELDYAFSKERNGIRSIRHSYGTKYHNFSIKWGGHKTFSLSADGPTRTHELDLIAQRLFRLNKEQGGALPPYRMTEEGDRVTIHYIGGGFGTGDKKDKTYTTPEEMMELAKNIVWTAKESCERSFQQDLAEITLTLAMRKDFSLDD
jgi:hypothetical protein